MSGLTYTRRHTGETEATGATVDEIDDFDGDTGGYKESYEKLPLSSTVAL